MAERKPMIILEPTVDYPSSQGQLAPRLDSFDGKVLTFEVRGGAFVDVETGSEWSLEGRALSGPLAGERLEMIPEAYVSFWFAFSTFFENPELWLP